MMRLFPGLLSAFFSAAFWPLDNVPPECFNEPFRPYTIITVPLGTCGGGSPACMKFTENGCLIKIEPYLHYGAPVSPQLRSALIAHERAHCACPNWVD